MLCTTGGENMPAIFLSPSTQEYNPYIDGGNEEYYMNLIADAMQPYLTASGIEYTRNDPEGNVNSSVSQSNAGNYAFHLAIHSNASPASAAGANRGVQVYYYPGSARSSKAAEIFVRNYKKIYPLPELVKAVPTTSLAEVVRTSAPAILIETAFHDNREDAQWIRENIGTIAENLSLSTAEFLDIPFRQPTELKKGIVRTERTALNLRKEPSVNSEILAKIPKGTILMLAGQYKDWYLTEYNGIQGYVNSFFIVPAASRSSQSHP